MVSRSAFPITIITRVLNIMTRILTRSLFTLCFALVTITSHGRALLLEGNLDAWNNLSVNGETQYQPIVDIDQGVVLKAHSRNSASGFVYTRSVDLTKTPILQWQWTAQQLPFFKAMSDDGIESRSNDYDETQKQGDDFVLRMIVGMDPLFGEKKSLHYVWAQNEKIGSHWQLDEYNHVMVVSGENQTTMEWQTLARHIQQDWKDTFGQTINKLDFVAFITDSDAISGEAVGYYGDIRTLVGKPIPNDHEIDETGKLVAKD